MSNFNFAQGKSFKIGKKNLKWDSRLQFLSLLGIARVKFHYLA